MIQNKIITCLVIPAVLALTAPAALADAIGMVDTMRVLNEYQGVGAAEKQFKSQVDRLKKAYEDRLRRLQDARKKNLPKAQFEKLEAQYTKEIEPMKAQVDHMNKELSMRLRKELDVAVGKVAAKRKLDVVFDKQAILHGGLDVTDDVLQTLNGK